MDWNCPLADAVAAVAVVHMLTERTETTSEQLHLLKMDHNQHLQKAQELHTAAVVAGLRLKLVGNNQRLRWQHLRRPWTVANNR
jgi:hypothetical protein